MHGIISSFALFALALTPVVHGHASANPPVGVPAKSMVTSIRIPHGCNKTATNWVSVAIPADVTSVKPQQIPGWTIVLTTRPLNPPVISDGIEVNTTTDTVTWQNGTLQDGYFMDFGLSVRMPAGPDGTVVAFETRQLCENGEGYNWTGTGAPKVTLMKNGTLLKMEDFEFATKAAMAAGTGAGASNSAAPSMTWYSSAAAAAFVAAGSALALL
ncbi:hypothetical protein DFJ77DRAFT_465393 [Powellomyces hirtus]|nr:hypothetical protein DFJ77DRAFT_465393 [Powellomyces hirtus]